MRHAYHEQKIHFPLGLGHLARKRRAKRPRCAGNDFHAQLRCLLARASSAVALCCCLFAKPSAGEVRSVSRVYHSACLERGQSYWDYENFRLSSLRWEDVDGYEVNGRLGFGRFSEVMEGVAVDSGRKVVLKVLKPARTYKVKREIRVLQLLAGGPNVLSLEGVCRDRHTGVTTLILEHLGDGVQWFGHTTASSSLPGTTAGGVRTAPGSPNAVEASPKETRPPPSPGREAAAADRGGAGATASSIGQGRALPWRGASSSFSTATTSTTTSVDRREGLEESRLLSRAGSQQQQQPIAAAGQDPTGEHGGDAARAAGLRDS
ncbi:unnamed protein product, partial [Ectocarpus fasciculatus]